MFHSLSTHLVVAEVDVECLIPAAVALLALESLPLPEEEKERGKRLKGAIKDLSGKSFSPETEKSESSHF